jgi:hypothetical protein
MILLQAGHKRVRRLGSRSALPVQSSETTMVEQWPPEAQLDHDVDSGRSAEDIARHQRTLKRIQVD